MNFPLFRYSVKRSCLLWLVCTALMCLYAFSVVRMYDPDAGKAMMHFVQSQLLGGCFCPRRPPHGRGAVHGMEVGLQDGRLGGLLLAGEVDGCVPDRRTGSGVLCKPAASAG